MRDLLIISHHFPPYNHIASNRIESICKYLDEEKYKITIITLDRCQENLESNEGIFKNVNIHRVKNNNYLRKANFTAPTNIVIHKMKAAYNKIYNRIFLDEYNAWTKEAIKLAESIIATQKVDVILTSYGPYSSLAVGLELKKKYPNLKWIIDMRDDFHTKKELKGFFNNKFIENIDGVTSVSSPILDNMKNRINNINSNVHFEEIRNGYDFKIDTPKRKVNEQFNITYTGSFYGEIKPDNFLKALSELTEDCLITNFRVNFIGTAKPFYIPSNIREYVDVIRERIPYNENVSRLKQSDLLLLILPLSSRVGVYSGKIFDYLGALRPIIALTPRDDVAAKLIVQSNSGYTAENEDISAIKEEIMNAYEDWYNNKVFSPNISLVKMHHRKEQINILNKFLDKIM